MDAAPFLCVPSSVQVHGPGELAPHQQPPRAAIDGHKGVSEEIQLLAEHDELPIHRANGFAVVFTKIGSGLKVWTQRGR